MVVWEARRLRQRAQAVSDKGIVGSSGRRPGGYHGFVWTRHTGMIDIRTEG
jgi:probable HAF family extracellular repeat protein